jgi:hypothetical protein
MKDFRIGVFAAACALGLSRAVSYELAAPGLS